MDVYDPNTGLWQAGPSLPVAVHSAGYVQLGRYLYVVGGLDRSIGSTPLAVTQRLDLVTEEWTMGPDLVEPRFGLALAATGAALYTLGGQGPSQYGVTPTDTVQRLALADWDTGQWTVMTDRTLPLVRSAAPAGWCTEGRAGGEIWSVGGAPGPERGLYLPTGERCYSPVVDLPWLTLPPAATGTVAAGRTAHMLVWIDARELTPGVHTATLLVTTSDPGRPEIRIPVRVTVR